MEWVETTGQTIEEAQEAALDELGVDAEDAEFEVIDEPKKGLFGKLRTEARVRARVRPVAPPAKDDRRRRGRTRKPASDAAPAPVGAGPAAAEPAAAVASAVAEATAETLEEGGGRRPPSRGRSGGSRRAADDNGGGRDRGGRPPSRRKGAGESRRDDRNEEGTNVDVPLDEQAEVATTFLQGLVDAFGVTAEISSSQPDEDTLELMLQGSDLGLLIGPKGATLLAVQDLTRTVVQRKTGAGNGRIHVDVGGYRAKRAEALTRFAVQIADEVKRSGTRKALEPMSAPDRKVVHDALTSVDGVSTMSEGEDARRRVVISPS